MTPCYGATGITGALEAAKRPGRPALAAFVTAGFPNKRGFGDVLAKVSEAADLIEVGVPFSDPMADGVTIQESSRIALENGVTLEWILESIATVDLQVPIVLMSYLNPLLAFGLEKLASGARDAGVGGFIVPDLPIEESALLREPLDEERLALIQMVTPVTPPGRRERIARATGGFLYAVTRSGTTGDSTVESTGGDAGLPVPTAVTEYLDDVRRIATTPVMAGFGIRHRRQVEALSNHVDGVIVGSALVECLAAGEDPAAFLSGLRDSPSVKGTSS